MREMHKLSLQHVSAIVQRDRALSESSSAVYASKQRMAVWRCLSFSSRPGASGSTGSGPGAVHPSCSVFCVCLRDKDARVTLKDSMPRSRAGA